MVASACFLVLLAVFLGPQDATCKAVTGDRKIFVNLAGTLKKMDTVVGGLERQHNTYQQAWAKLKAMEASVTTQDQTMKTVRTDLGLLEPQMITLAETLDNLNVSVNREKESLAHLDEYLNEELRETKEDIRLDGSNIDEQLAEIDQGVDDQKRQFPQLLRQEAERQAGVRDGFRQQLQDYQSMREEKQTEIEELVETVSSQVAALRSKDRALDDRVAALQTRVQSMTQNVAGLAAQLSTQRSQLETQEATLSGEGEHLTNARNSFETQVQQFDQIQDLLGTIQATVTALQTRKGQIQNQTVGINAQIQDQQSRLNNNEQQQQSLGQQVEDLSGNHEQQSNANSQRMDDVEATLDTLAADTGAADSVTQVESTVQSLQASITGLNSNLEQNQNLEDSISQQQISQQSSIQIKDAALQAYTQTLEALDGQIESYGATYEDQVSTEEARMQIMETRLNSADSSRSDTFAALQNIVDGLSTNVEGAEEQFAQYTSPSAILENLASVGQSIEDVENTQTALSDVEQQLTDSGAATNERFSEVETALQNKQEALQQAQSDLQVAAQNLETASVVADNVDSLNTRVTANTEECNALSSSAQQVDTNYRQPLQTQRTALQQQLAAIPDNEVQQAMAAAVGVGLQQMTLQLNNLGTSVDNLKEVAIAIGTSSNSTFESLQDDLGTVSTQLSNHQSAITALQSDQTDGLAETVNTLEETVAGLTSSINDKEVDIASIERAVQQSGSSNSVDRWETGEMQLSLRSSRDWLGRTRVQTWSLQTRDVRFTRRFRSPPVVYATMTKVDTNKGDNVRLQLIVERVTTSGFRWKFGPWSSTKFYSGKAKWIALGQSA